jgi:2-oxoglutarate ferredoxin oxidoreductase subunit alpha
MDKTQGKVIIDGNSASALGCVFAGVTMMSWYPITPSSSLAEGVIEYLKRFRITPEGKATFAVVQAEDELAAIGMVLGAGWAGARAMTTTSGPGISLMSEFAGLAYYAEIPGVIWDVQRVGPSTGLPTRTSQGDLLSTAFLSHWRYQHIMLFPASPLECFEMGMEAFNVAEKFQTLVFVMSDLDLGMNNWMSEPFAYPEKPIQRGKVLTKEDLDRLGSFGRYQDVDGDGIPYRTLPGTEHPKAAYFTARQRPQRDGPI